MTSMIESVAAFKQRCNEIQASGDLYTKLSAQTIDSFRSLAFAMGSPQAPPTDAQFEAFTTAFFGSGASIGQKAMIRHLHFEASALVVQTYRDMAGTDSAGSTAIRRIPPPEKRARLEKQKSRLNGLMLVGELEPSYQLLDVCNHQYETGVLTWIPPSKCSKREVEISAGQKDNPSLLKVEQGVLKVGPGAPSLECDVSDSLRAQWAWMRRGIACDSCCVISYNVHQKWVQKLLDCRSHTPPPGYSAVSIQQCVRADRELFMLLAREVAPPFKVDSTGKSPLDAHIERLMCDPRVQQCLLPLQRASASLAADAISSKPNKPGKPQPKSKMKGKGKVSKEPRGKPDELKGYDCRTPDGNVCWGHNLDSGCKEQTKKNAKGIPFCTKGLHICVVCHKVGHGLSTCRAKKE